MIQSAGPIVYMSDMKYQLAEDWWVDSPIKGQPCTTDFCVLALDGRLTVLKGFAWDGPSGPTVDTKDFQRGALAHDALYCLMSAGKLSQDCRKSADKLLYDLCREDGMSFLRAKYVYAAVRWFGKSSAAREAPRLQRAPR